MSRVNLLTTAQVATRLGISRQAVVARVRSGSLDPAFKAEGDRGGYLFDPSDVPASDGEGEA